MIVYVESNFILELAYLQEEYESCERILALAEGRAITLALPAFCLGEPFESSTRRWRRRKDLRERFDQEIRELSRSQPYRALSGESQEITKALAQSEQEEKQRLDGIIARIVDAVVLIPLDRLTIQAALRLQDARKLSSQDAIVYASVLAHMAGVTGEDKCLLTKNSKDFANPDIGQDLQAQDCTLLTRFEHGLGYIQSRMGQNQPSEQEDGSA